MSRTPDRLRDAIDRSVDRIPLAIRDLEGRILLWTGADEALFGWSAQAARGRDADALLQARYPLPRAETLDLLMLLNPADAYRLINLTGHEAMAQVAAMSVPVEAGLSPWALYAALTAWIVLPLTAAVAVMARRQP